VASIDLPAVSLPPWTLEDYTTFWYHYSNMPLTRNRKTYSRGEVLARDLALRLKNLDHYQVWLKHTSDWLESGGLASVMPFRPEPLDSRVSPSSSWVYLPGITLPTYSRSASPRIYSSNIGRCCSDYNPHLLVRKAASERHSCSRRLSLRCVPYSLLPTGSRTTGTTEGRRDR